MDTLAKLQMAKTLIIAAAVVLLFAFRLREQDKAWRPWLNGCLVALAALSTLAYFDFGQYPKFGRFLNPHDFFHYYLGSKYSPELGYLNLYPAVLVADAENNGGKSTHAKLRSMETYRFVPARQILAQKDKYKGLFTTERWNAFRADVRTFQGMLGPQRWGAVLVDKGYNATPIWNMVARLFSSITPAKHLEPLMMLDMVLLLLMFGLIYWAFGIRTLLFSIVFFGTLFPMAYTHIRGAFLRLDWVTLLVMGIALIKKERYKTAGVCMAYAGAARIFPTVFVFGLGAKFLLDTIRKRALDRRYGAFFAAFASSAALLFGLSVLTDGGLGPWREFLAKIHLHDNDLSPIRVGFRYVFLWTNTNAVGQWGAFETAKMQFWQSHQVLWWVIQGVVLLFSFGIVQRLEDCEAVAYGYALAYFLFAPTFYYHVMLVVALFLFLPKAASWPHLFGVVWLFLLSAILFLLNRRWALDLELSFSMSILLLLTSLYMMFVAGWAPPVTAALPVTEVELKKHPKKR